MLNEDKCAYSSKPDSNLLIVGGEVAMENCRVIGD